MSQPPPTREPGRRPMPLHWKIAIGFAAGLLLGLLVHYGIGADAPWVQSLTKYVTQPFGTLFLSLVAVEVLFPWFRLQWADSLLR